MSQRPWLVLALLALPTPLTAQPVGASPETLLPREALLYMRFDGLAPHRQAYDRTAVADLMKGELGNLLSYLFKFATDPTGPLAKSLVAELPPEKVALMVKSIGQVEKFLDTLNRRGIAAGVEVLGVEPPRFQLTIVFPTGGDPKDRETVLQALEFIVKAVDAKVKQTKISGRDITEVEETEPVRIAWWAEGQFVVYTAGTEKPEHTLALLGEGAAKRQNLTSLPLFRTVTAFKGYETLARGFLNFEGGLEFARQSFPQVVPIIDQLGLDSLKHLTFHVGFEGRASRSTVMLHLGKERKGVVRLLSSTKALNPDVFTGVASDASTVNVGQFEFGQFYDIFFETAEAILKIAAPDELPRLREIQEQAKQMAGIDIRKDLLEQLGPTILTYDSPSESILSTGTVYVVQVKDAARVQESIKTMLKSIAANAGQELPIKKSMYHGVELQTVTPGVPGFFYAPTFAFHKNTLVIGMFPQPVQGHILRVSGKLPSWKPSPMLEKAIAEASKQPNARVVALSEVDPRPGIRFVLSLLPIAGGVINSFAGGQFDLTLLPNAHAVTQPLFPNVTITVDEGEIIRMESYESVGFLSGGSTLEWYIAGLIFGLSESLSLP